MNACLQMHRLIKIPILKRDWILNLLLVRCPIEYFTHVQGEATFLLDLCLISNSVKKGASHKPTYISKPNLLVYKLFAHLT